MSCNQDANTKDLVKAGYDKIGSSYQDFMTSLPNPQRSWTDKLISALPSANRTHVLELGCGPGAPGTQYLASTAGHVTANELSPVQLSLARRNLAQNSNVTFVEGDMASLDFADRVFDGVVAMYSLQHLPRDDQPKMLKTVHRWLRKDGVLLVNFDEDEVEHRVMDDWLGASMFHSGFGAKGSLKMVKEAGFDVLEESIVRDVEGKKTVPFLWVLARKS